MKQQYLIPVYLLIKLTKLSDENKRLEKEIFPKKKTKKPKAKDKCYRDMRYTCLHYKLCIGVLVTVNV